MYSEFKNAKPSQCPASVWSLTEMEGGGEGGDVNTSDVNVYMYLGRESGGMDPRLKECRYSYSWTTCDKFPTLQNSSACTDTSYWKESVVHLDLLVYLCRQWHHLYDKCPQALPFHCWVHTTKWMVGRPGNKGSFKLKVGSGTRAGKDEAKLQLRQPS